MMKDFKDNFKQLTRTHDNSIVFRDWLDYSIDQFLINPKLKYFKHENYSEYEHGLFYELFSSWINGMNVKLESGDVKWYDFVGELYEECVLSGSKASNMGQFFTPHHVCDLMVNVSGYEGKTCYDPAGGSGRLCLAYHTLNPEALCFSHDLDEFACKMAVLNFLIHGIKGSVCRCDSLTGEFYEAWKIHEFPFTIMSVDSMKESLIFIGEDTPKFTDSTIANDSDGDVVVVKSKEDTQTTLI